MSARSRATAYAAQVSERNKARRSRPDNFTSKKTGPPTYAFADQQRGHQDDVADDSRPTRQALKEEQEDKGEDEVDKDSFTPAAPTGKARPAKATTAGPSSAPPPSAKPAFMKCWTTVDEMDIPARTEDEKSSFVPNAIKIFLILFQMELLLLGNEELKWISPNYFSLPVRLYYSVIFYVQVLRAKEQAGTLSKSEGSWLRAFFRRYKDTLLPIAGPLVPVFSNIVSMLPPDARFEYVHPGFRPQGGYSSVAADNNLPRCDAQHFLLPCPSILLGFFQHYASRQDALPNTMWRDGSFVPFVLATGGTLANVVFPAAPAAPNLPNAMLFPFMYNIVIDSAIPEDRQTLDRIRPFWFKSALKKKSPQINVAQDFNPQTVGAFMRMEDSFDWFQPCVDMANVQVKFFTDSTTLSNIPTVGGSSSTVDCRISSTSVRATPTNASTYAWHNEAWTGATARFRSLDADLTIDEKYNAIFSLTCGKINWTGANNHFIGSFTEGQRVGPYFDQAEGKVQYQSDYDVSIDANLYSMLQTEFYQYDGKA